MGVLDGWQHCPRCAAALSRHDGHVECGECGFVQYANSAPTASAFLVDDAGRVLLARRAYEPDAGLWDVPGGFLEEGESPLDGLRRELLKRRVSRSRSETSSGYSRIPTAPGPA